MVWSTYGGCAYFLSIYTCCDHGLDGNRCNVNYGYDDYEYEVVP